MSSCCRNVDRSRRPDEREAIDGQRTEAVVLRTGSQRVLTDVSGKNRCSGSDVDRQRKVVSHLAVDRSAEADITCSVFINHHVAGQQDVVAEVRRSGSVEVEGSRTDVCLPVEIRRDGRQSLGVANRSAETGESAAGRVDRQRAWSHSVAVDRGSERHVARVQSRVSGECDGSRQIQGIRRVDFGSD